MRSVLSNLKNDAVGIVQTCERVTLLSVLKVCGSIFQKPKHLLKVFEYQFPSDTYVYA